MVDKIGQFATLVDFLASAHDGFGQRSRTATEDAYLANVTVLLLNEFEERCHVGTAKVIHRFQAGEHTALRDALKMVLANVEHGGAQIKLVEELRDEDVHLQNVGDILAFDVAQHVDEPLKVTMRRARPQEVDFLASHARIAVGRRTEDQVVEDRCIGCDSDAAANHDGHLELVPILISATKRAVQLDFRIHLLGVEVARIEVVAQLPRPWPLRLDVARQEILVGRRCECERMELLGRNSGA